MKSVGVLALQGDVREHRFALDDLGVKAVEVRSMEELEDVDALVIPGGESTAISYLLERADLFEPIDKRIKAGMPVLGTCAGMILLADNIEDGRPDQKSFRAMDISVLRNAYGAQSASFEGQVKLFDQKDFLAVFIRAPRVTSVGDKVEVLGRFHDDPVLCRQGPIVVSSFHPELSQDRRIHELFLEGV